MNHRNLTIIVLLVLFGLGSALYAFQGAADEPVPPEATSSASTTSPEVDPTAPVVSRPTSNNVVVDAKVVPAASAELNFESRGTFVAEVLVQEGDTVAQGDPLVRLDTQELALRVDDARASLSEAEALYEQLLTGATPEEVEQSRARIAEAQAELQQVEGSVTPQDVTAAQAELDEARVELAELEAGPRTAEVVAAQADLEEAQVALAELAAGPKTTEVEVAQAALTEAQATLQTTRDRLSAAKTTAESQMEQAANEVRDRQAEYSIIYWNNLALDEPTAEERESEAQALRAVETAEQDLEQAKVAYETAQQAERTGIAAAETDVQSAQAKLEQLVAGADPDELAEARAAVAAAEAALDRLNASTDSDELAAARAQVAAAEAKLARLQGGQRAGALEAAAARINEAQAGLAEITAAPPAADLAEAEAQIQRAQVTLKQAELAFERATLQAPIDGVIAALNIESGEVPTGDQPIMVLADTSEWHIETEGLSELSIVHVTEGDPVTITFFALPELELPGTVMRVKPLGENAEGETTYTVTVTPDEWDERLRWNMTAQVRIATGTSTTAQEAGDER